MKIFTALSTLAVAFSLTATLGMSTASAATPDVLATVTQPVGVAATQNQVLVSQPYCVNDSQTGPLSPSQWQIVAIDNAGNQTVFAQLPANPDYGVSGKLSNCEETYLAVASGLLSGFPSGHVYAAQGGFIYDFDAGGNLVTHGANNFLAFIPSLEVPFAHTSITFDNVGTFGNDLIITGTDSSNIGEIWTVDSAGNTTQLATLSNGGKAACNGPAGVPCFEGPDVAPLMGPVGGTFPGWLFAVEPGLSGISADIGALQPGHSTISQVGGVAVPEAARFVPSTPCGFNDKVNGKTYEFFNANFSAPGGSSALANTIYAYPTSAFTGVVGQLIVTTEGGSPGVVVSTDANIDFTAFDSTIYNSEGSNFVQCISICDCMLKKKCKKDDAGGGDDEHNSGNDKSYGSRWKSSSKKTHAAWDQNNNNNNGNHTGDDDEADCPGSEQSPADNNGHS